MLMQVDHLLKMGGYASYVWSAYGACFVVLCTLPLFAQRRRRAVLRRLAKRGEYAPTA